MVIVVIKKIKEKVLNNIKENKWIYITFIVSSIIISVIYTFNHIRPFGNNSMLDVDFYHQYGPLLNELYDRVKEGSTLLFSFNTGGGIPFYRNFLNYLSSPFNIILFFFKKENIIMAFSIIIGLKAVMASVTMSYYLKKVFKKDNCFLTVFSIFYAFSGYFCAYYWNIMWLDGMVFLPLIALGINKLVDEDKPIFYTCMLSFMLFANYFIAYMICIFSVLYFLGYFLYKGKYEFYYTLKKFFIFGFFSILAAGLSSFALIPLYHALSSISATTDNFPTFSYSFKLLDYMFNHLTGVSRTVFASDKLPLPNIYPGMLTLLCISLFFINKKINYRAKILALLSIIIFYFSFNVKPFDFTWHAFHVPNDLPYRYSFLYVFVLTTIGYKSILCIKDINKLLVSICSAILIIFVLVALKLEFVNINDTKAIICIILILCYYLIYLISDYKRVPKVLIMVLIVLIPTIECTYGIVSNWSINHDIDTFMQSKPIVQDLITNIRESDNDLYRIEKTDYLTLNDPAWFNYMGISTFSSMAYESVSKFQRNFGLSGNTINSYYYKDFQTPVYNTLFNVKYLIGDTISNDYYNQIDIETKYDSISYLVTKYNYSSSIAYAVNKDIKAWNLVQNNPFQNQKDFINYIMEDDLYEPIKVKEVQNVTIENENFKENTNGEFYYIADAGQKNFIFTLDNPKKQNIYLYVAGSDVAGFEVDSKYYSITSDEFYTLDIGNKDKGEVEVKIYLRDSGNNNIRFYAYSINDEKFQNFYKKIKSESLDVIEYSETYIKGKVNVESDKTMFTSVAYDKGWSVLVDGKKVKTYKIADSYLGFDISKGKHTIEYKYYPEKMKEGVLISFISFVILWLYYFIDKGLKIKKIKKEVK